jgi:hypothetical protein
MKKELPDYEEFDGGDAYIEADRLQELGRRIMAVQKALQDRARLAHPLRAFHAKIRLGITNARLEIRNDLPDWLRVGYFGAGRVYDGVIVRLSNASGSIQPDSKRDMRGIALRVKVSEAECHDLLLTNGEVSHARNGTEFVTFAEAMAGSRLLLPWHLLFNVGPFTTLRMLRNLSRNARGNIDSLAGETYWSRGALRWGAATRGRLKLVPVDFGPLSEPPSKESADYLRTELARRLNTGDIRFDLYFQPFVDTVHTPVEDASVLWSESTSAPIPVARLVIPGQDIDSVQGQHTEEYVDRLAFNPWNTTPDFRPLGHINRARKVVYQASSAHRLQLRFLTTEVARNRILSALARVGFRTLNLFVPWHRLPTTFAALNLLAFRQTLRARNLHDTEDRDAPPTPVQPVTIPEAARAARTDDGSFNDLSVPTMGQEAPPHAGPAEFAAADGVGATFGRNVPLTSVQARSASEDPSPVTVSDQVLAREQFLPARSLNLLAACWIQFQVHDWVDHPRYPLDASGARQIELPLPSGRTWQNHENGSAETCMRIADNIPKNTRDPRLAGKPVFRNDNSPWWDAGQLYGDTGADALRLREEGGRKAELRLDNGFLPDHPDPRLTGVEDTGFNENWWLGLSFMHTLFAREHNTVVGELRRAYRGWDEDKLYQTARLVVAALIAKIHTVEWTPAILATKTIDMALRTNWYGAPKDWMTQLGIWLFDAHALKGIPESVPDHQRAPYSLTEEFVTVYRMHPLVPDDYAFAHAADGRAKSIEARTPPDAGRAAGSTQATAAGSTQATATPTFWQIQGQNTLAVMRQIGLSDLAYSFGTSHPGAITLHNYPNHLRRFTRRNGERIDLAVVDLVRDRRRGIPRYNDFRALLHRPRVRHFNEITANAEWARQLEDMYKDVDRLDTMVGLLAEDAPAGFGFSDTAFRVFILMASRRLQSDRFFTVDFRPEVYSPLGMDWISRNGMKEVLERHCPEIARYLPRDASAFAPWRPADAR